MNYSTITHEDCIQLVKIILETSDDDVVIDFELFSELVVLLSEDIPGLEFLSDEDLSFLISDCWTIYQQNPLSNPSDQ